MRSDGGMLRYLLNRNAPAGSGARRDLAFGFDGTDDYISSNATIGRTGYNMNVSGNVTTGSDGDGSYIWINGNRSHTASTGTRAEMLQTTGPTLTQATSFTMKVRFKIIATQPDNASGLFGYNYGASIWMENNVFATGFKCRIREGGSFQDVSMGTYALNTMYDAYLVYDASVQKMYCYFGSILVNVGGTSVSFSFTDNSNLYLGDNSIGGGNASSSNKYIYHACIRNRALTQAEIDADIALGNTTKQDPSIVAYYVPENLQYNTQYMLDPKDLSSASWLAIAGTTVTANTTVAPDGTTTADTVNLAVGALSRVDQANLTISGSTIASKTFIIKAFVKVAAGTSTFRLRMTHRSVLDYQSADLTATTDWQEFTFTQTFTSSTSGTGIIGAVLNGTDALVKTLQVRNVRVYLVNETLRDESPNIGGFIGRKTQKVLSCRIKPGADGTASANSQALIYAPRAHLHVRDTGNQINMRYDDRIGAHTSVSSLGNGFRNKAHIIGCFFRTGSVWATKLYVNGVLVDSDTFTITAPTGAVSTVLRAGRAGSTYYTGNIRDTRIYTFTGSFTDADALAIYNGGEPTSAGVTKYLHYKPPVGELGTTTQDQSTNNRDGTLNGGVTRDYI